jgi:predicted transcriptional regulator
MRRNKILFVELILVCITTIFLTQTAVADDFIPKFDNIGISLAVLVAVIATIFAFFSMGGIKYITPENVLDTEVRKNLYTYIEDYPGSHLREIARELDLKPSNAAWHLRKLEQTNLVRSREIGGKRVYYLVEGGVEARKEAIAEAILKNKNAKEIMIYLVENPGKHLLEIANALNLNHHTVKWHIKKMYLAELVDGDTSNSAYPVYYPTDAGIEISNKFSDMIKKPGRAS